MGGARPKAGNPGKSGTPQKVQEFLQIIPIIQVIGLRDLVCHHTGLLGKGNHPDSVILVGNGIIVGENV